MHPKRNNVLCFFSMICSSKHLKVYSIYCYNFKNIRTVFFYSCQFQTYESVQYIKNKIKSVTVNLVFIVYRNASLEFLVICITDQLTYIFDLYNIMSNLQNNFNSPRRSICHRKSKHGVGTCKLLVRVSGEVGSERSDS